MKLLQICRYDRCEYMFTYYELAYPQTVLRIPNVCMHSDVLALKRVQRCPSGDYINKGLFYYTQYTDHATLICEIISQVRGRPGVHDRNKGLAPIVSLNFMGSPIHSSHAKSMTYKTKGQANRGHYI